MGRLLLASCLLLAACGGGSASGVGVGGPVKRIAAPAPRVMTAAGVGSSPSALAVGFGAVWVASRDGGTVTRVDARSGRPALSGAFPRPLRAGQGPLAISAGEGAVWVAAADGTITRIDPAQGAARAVARVRDPGGIAAGAGGVWVTSRAGGTLTRLDPRTGRPSGRALRVGRLPGDVAVGGGSVWVVNTADGTVSRVDPGAARTAADPIRVADPKGQALALTYGDGGVWVAKTDTPEASAIAVVRIDPSGGEVDPDPIRIMGGVPLDLAAGAGAVWATDVGNLLPGSGRPAGLQRIDPEARALAGPLVRTGPTPSAVAVGAGAVWVTSAGDGALTRIVPTAR